MLYRYVVIVTCHSFAAVSPRLFCPHSCPCPIPPIHIATHILIPCQDCAEFKKLPSVGQPRANLNFVFWDSMPFPLVAMLVKHRGRFFPWAKGSTLKKGERGYGKTKLNFAQGGLARMREANVKFRLTRYHSLSALIQVFSIAQRGLGTARCFRFMGELFSDCHFPT